MTQKFDREFKSPDLFYIGPPKTGTTFIRSYFGNHPDITFTRRARVFREIEFSESIDGYLNELPDISTSCFIEMTEGLGYGSIIPKNLDWGYWGFNPNIYRTDLVFDHFEIAKRIKTIFPDTRILISIRNQIDWFRSNYKHFYKRLPKGQRNFSDYIKTQHGKMTIFSGHFDQLVTAYIHYFGPERVKVILLEEIIQSQENVFRDLCNYLGVSYFENSNNELVQNKGRNQLEIVLHQYSLENNFLLQFVPESLKRQMKNLFALSFLNSKFDLLSQRDIDWLTSLYSVSNIRLSSILGLSLDDYGYPV